MMFIFMFASRIDRSSKISVCPKKQRRRTKSDISPNVVAQLVFSLPRKYNASFGSQPGSENPLVCPRYQTANLTMYQNVPGISPPGHW